jgi:RNA-dependent RNA polymerase
MEKLSDYGQQLKQGTLARIRAQIDRCPTDRDPALTAPYDEVVQRINRLRSEQKESEILVELLEKDLSLIKQHVKEAFDQYKADSTKGPPGNFTNLPIGHRQDTLRKRSRVFNSKPDQCMFWLMSAKDVEQVKASYAYTYDWEQSRPPSRFPWNVAFRELCMLKCGKDMKPVDRRFYDHMSVKPSRPAVRS